MFDHFTHRARKALVLARQEAERSKHNFIDTEHVLLGLLSEGTTAAFGVLQNAGVELEQARIVAGELVGPAPDFVTYGQLPYGPDVRAAFNRAEEEAHGRKHIFVDAEHLLLGILRIENAQALAVLRRLNVDLISLRRELTVYLATVEQEPLRPLALGQVVAEAAAVAFGQSLDRFTDRARRVIEHSRCEAEVLKHDYVGTEHLLIGLLTEGSGVAAAVLFGMGADLQKIRMALFKLATPSRRYETARQFPLTIQAKDALRFSAEEARARKHDYVGTEHLLLGLLRVDGGPANHILKSLSLDAESIRREVAMLIGAKESFLGGRPKDGTPEQIWPQHAFTDPARKALDLAVEEAGRDGGLRIGSEHLLIGLSRVDFSIGARVLTALGAELEKIRTATGLLPPVPPSGQQQDRPTPDQNTRKALQLAQMEAADSGRNHVGTEHLLLGLTGEKDMRALQVLEHLGISAVQVRTQLREFRPSEQTAPDATGGSVASSFLLIGPSIEEETVWSDYDWAQEHMSSQASRALFLAGQEADRLNSPFTGTEHLLLGLLMEGKGMAAEVLRSCGLQVDPIRDALGSTPASTPAPGAPASSDRPFAPDLEKAIELAKNEARDRRHSHLGTEHLLMGMLNANGKAAEVFARLAINPDQVRDLIRQCMDDASASAPAFDL